MRFVVALRPYVGGATLLRLAVHGIRLCILLCTTVVLIVDVSFKVCRVLCKDVTDRAVWVCVILKRLL